MGYIRKLQSKLYVINTVSLKGQNSCYAMYHKREYFLSCFKETAIDVLKICLRERKM